ncbi:hypothetical protein QT235_16320 [Geobacillus stearothermophilus]|nr:hypothetical protein IMZ17_15635 [Geobacillus stearothermophilus]WJQ09007.1 hypothetical protein QT235_16320 [Geobacillus stearothermophilus]
MNKVTHLTHEGKEKEAMPFPGLLFGAPFIGGFLGGLLGGALAPRPFYPYPPYPPYPGWWY